VWTKLRGDTLFIESGGKVIIKHKLARSSCDSLDVQRVRHFRCLTTTFIFLDLIMPMLYTECNLHIHHGELGVIGIVPVFAAMGSGSFV
jgi:hypothetical protein